MALNVRRIGKIISNNRGAFALAGIGAVGIGGSVAARLNVRRKAKRIAKHGGYDKYETTMRGSFKPVRRVK